MHLNFQPTQLMCHLKSPPDSNCTWDALSFEQCLFNKRLPNRLKTFSGLWSLGITLQYIWIDHNDLVFNNNMLHRAKIERVIWVGLLDYDTLEWQHTL
jgi:hypothetical protein